MPQNHKLNCSFGPYEPGAVVPGYVFAGHDLAALTAQGLVEPTDAAVTVKVAVPKVPTPALPEDVVADRNRLADRVAGLTNDNIVLVGQVAELERHRDALKAEIGKYVEENAHLRAACDAHQAKIAELEKLLEAATEPAE